MKKIQILLLLCLGVSVCPGKEPAEFDLWLKSFYRTDDITGFEKHWQHVVGQKLLEDEKAVAPIVGFFSQVLHRHPELIAGRLDDLGKFTKPARKTVAAILWNSDTEQGRKVLGASAETERSGTRPPRIAEKRIDEPTDLDFCWGYFFATGDALALDPIIGALDFAKHIGSIERFKTGSKTDADKAAVLKEAMFQAAMWSLGANGRECPEVLAHLEKVFAAKTTPDERRLWIAGILSKLKPEKYKIDFSPGKGARIIVTPDAKDEPREPGNTWRDREGNAVQQSDECKSVAGFGAHIVPTTDQDWEAKWNTPAEQTPKFTKATSIAVGERLAFLVFFSNPLPDKNGEVEVVYDATIRSPDGKVEKLPGLKGIKGKLGGPASHTYLVATPIGFAGGKDDAKGTWIFEFAVRDVVRGVTVPLKTTITLTDDEAKPKPGGPAH